MNKWEKYNEYNPKNPTFSSNLLDKINKSIKNNTKNDLEDDLSFCRATKESKNTKVDKKSTLRRANLVDKWMENKKEAKQSKVINKSSNTLLEEFDVQDTLFFSTTSTSSSSSEAEYYSSGYTHPMHQQHQKQKQMQMPRVTCFTPHVPKPIRTRPEQKVESKFLQQQQNSEELFKSRSRAVKMYSNLKNLKQPISPGVRLTSFINSLFTNKDKNKNKNKNEIVVKSEKIRTTSYSACTTPTSYSRSCLSNTNNDKNFNDDHGIKRTVRFCPIVDQDSQISVKKLTSISHMQPKHQSIKVDDNNVGLNSQISTSISKFARNDKELEEVALDLWSGYCWGKKVNSKPSGKIDKVNDYDYGSNYGVNYDRGVNNNHDYDDNNGNSNDNDNDDDGLSCSSSDLFELDHLSLIGNELPVYETTRFDPKFC